MAERRMFSKSVIGSARFLRMPPSSRLLYYDLGMAADDDGVVEAFSVMRMTGAVEDDLKVLVSKGFITVLNEDLVAYIEDWSKNNQIRKDRYQPSIYQNLLVQIGAVNQLETVGQPDGNQRLTQDMVTFVNLFLVAYSDTAIAFFGAYFKVQQLIVMTVNGLIQGCLPVMRFNYGAGNSERLHSAFRYGTALVIGMMILGTLAVILFPAQILGLFTASETMRSFGISAMRIMAASYR